MAGLPGTGKSTLARRVAAELGGLVIDKDSIRAALFGPFVDYSREQDDLSMECVYAAARYMAPQTAVFIDGRAFTQRYQWERALNIAGADAQIIETVCSGQTARSRIEAASGAHLAGNRTFGLYLTLKARREPIPAPKLIVNTEQDLELCVTQCLAYLALKI